MDGEFDEVCLRVRRRLGEDSGDWKAWKLLILCMETKSTAWKLLGRLSGALDRRGRVFYGGVLR